MYRGCTVGVVVPAFNEGQFVADVLAAIPGYVDRVYAVDDASTDGTWAAIQRAANGPDEDADEGDATPRIVPLRHATNRGAGAAIKTGYRRALDDGLDVTVTIDGDGQMDPRLMTRVLDPVVAGRADYAKGDRLSGPFVLGEMPVFRWIGNWLLTWLTKVASGYWRLRDPQNGYTAISRRALEAVDLDALFEDYGYSNDLLVRLNAAEMRVADVAMPAAYGDEASSIRYGSYVPTVSVLLLRRFLWRLQVRYRSQGVHHVWVCYLLGLLGAAYGAAIVLGTAAVGGSGLAVPVGTAGATPLFVGVSVVTVVAMAFDRQANRSLEVRVE